MPRVTLPLVLLLAAAVLLLALVPGATAQFNTEWCVRILWCRCSFAPTRRMDAAARLVLTRTHGPITNSGVGETQLKMKVGGTDKLTKCTDFFDAVRSVASRSFILVCHHVGPATRPAQSTPIK